MKLTMYFLLALSLFAIGCKENQSQAGTQQAQEQSAVNTVVPPQAAATELTPAVKSALKQNLEARSQLKVTRIEGTPISGMFAVFVDGGEVVYSNADASYFIAGDLYKVRADARGLENVTETYRAEQRVAALDNIDIKDTITFPAQGEKKTHVYVFTDVDCYYCQKLHNEVAALNKAGVEVRYLAFPRAGLNSESYNKIQSAWCAKNKQEALTKLKARQPIPSNLCSSTAVAKEFALGQELGVRGTPSIFTTSGEVIAGYLPTAQLLARIGVKQ